MRRRSLECLDIGLYGIWLRQIPLCALNHSWNCLDFQEILYHNVYIYRYTRNIKNQYMTSFILVWMALDTKQWATLLIILVAHNVYNRGLSFTVYSFIINLITYHYIKHLHVMDGNNLHHPLACIGIIRFNECSIECFSSLSWWQFLVLEHVLSTTFRQILICMAYVASWTHT